MKGFAPLRNRRRGDPLVIGMVHLLPLPGAPRYGGDLDAVREAMVRDGEALAEGGAGALLVENYGDAPFFPGPVPPETIASMTALAAELRHHVDLPLGINVLRNDGLAALAVAAAAGASFVRVNILCGARLTDQGIIEGRAHEILRARTRLGLEKIAILADAAVKHSAPLAKRPLEEEIAELTGRGGADGVILTGPATGAELDLDALRRARDAAGECPLLAGSGITPENAPRYAGLADGLIVGTSLKEDGRTTAPVDPARVRALVMGLRRIRENLDTPQRG